MKLNRVLSMLLAGLLFAVLLPDAALAVNFTPALDTSTVCDLRIAGNYKNFEALEAEFDRFNEWYPDVSLEYVALDDYNNAITVALAGAEAPDIFCAFTWMVDKADRYQSMFESAEDLGQAGLDLGCIREGLLYVDADGKVPMAPVLSTTYGMMVNEDIFAREGLSVPRTYSELISTCEALKSAGYVSPIMGYNTPNAMFCALILPQLYADIRNDTEAVEKLNALENGSGEYTRSTLEMVDDLMKRGFVDLDACASIEDGYSSLILRFFEGDVPMMITNGDTVSGTKKRESMSEAFIADPFSYSFQPIPTTEEGGYFLNTASMHFAVNRNSANLDMSNEFMRFLLNTDELNEMARVKRVVTASNDLTFDALFAGFAIVDAEHTIIEQNVALLDKPQIQARTAAWLIANGKMDVDAAVNGFGTFEEP